MRLSGELQVHLSRLEKNYSLLKKLAPSNDTIFMVKANAYGHGICEIVSFAYKELGIKSFGVASTGEAKQIRMMLPDILCDIFVFSDTQVYLEEGKELYLNYNVVPVLSNIEDLKYVLENSEYSHLPIVLKFNTGMNRLGIELDELDDVIKALKISGRKVIEHLMTHFSSSYIPLKDGDRTNRQYEKFKNLKSKLKDFGIEINQTSVSNSGAIEQKFGLEESHIRPGLMLYGAKSHPKSQWSGESISDLKTSIIKSCVVRKGTPIGYGAHTCHDDGHLLYLALGYGDGIITYYSGKKITLYGKEARVLGRVNMDITTVFFKDLPIELQNSKEFYFWGDKASDISELAQQLKTTPYQVFTAINSRVPRRYIL